MTDRVQKLRQDFEQGLEKLIGAIERFPDDRWHAPSDDEGWTNAASARHVGYQFELELEYLTAHAAQRPLPSYTWDDVHKRNNDHAARHANCTKADAIQTIRDGSKAVFAFFDGITDEQLDRKAPLALADGAEATLQDLILGGVLIDHVRAHTEAMAAG